jgi:hypothetical protein
MKEDTMFRIPSRLVIGFVVLGLSPAVAPGASVSSTPVGFVRTDVKMEAKDIEARDIKAKGSKVIVSPAASPHPLTLRSLSSAHAVEVHPFVATPDTEDTHTLRVESK